MRLLGRSIGLAWDFAIRLNVFQNIQNTLRCNALRLTLRSYDFKQFDMVVLPCLRKKVRCTWPT